MRYPPHSRREQRLLSRNAAAAIGQRRPTPCTRSRHAEARRTVPAIFSGAASKRVAGGCLRDPHRFASPASCPRTGVQASVERDGGRLLARFSRAYDDTFRGDAAVPAIAAYHTSDEALLQQHEGSLEVDLSLTGGGATASADNTPKLRRWHAALMLISWGVLLPLGAIMAATMRTVGPKSMWCAPADRSSDGRAQLR